MTPEQAANVFRRHGVSLDELSTQAGIKAARNRLMMTLHSDLNDRGDEAAAALNVAYGVLKQLPSGYQEAPQPEAQASLLPVGSFGQRLGSYAAPSGQGERRSVIKEESYRDVNYLKKRMWELNGGSRQRYEAFYYDGQLREPILVYGSPAIFHHISEAICTHHGGNRGFGHRAVLARREGERDMLVIYLNGRNLAPAVPLEIPCRCDDPRTDHGFLASLPGVLSAIGRDTARTARPAKQPAFAAAMSC